MTLLCFFCNIRFSFITPYLEVSTNITFRKNEIHQLAFYWMIVLCTGLISGAYVLGKYFEEKSNCLFRLYLIISVGTVLSCLLLYFFNLQGNYITNYTLLLVTRFINVFFHPIAFITPALILMKIYKGMQNIKISAYFILAAISGMQMSYFATLYVAQNNLQLLCKLFLFASILIVFIAVVSAPLLKILQNNLAISSNFRKANPMSIVLSLLIGCVFNTGMRYHYFFIDRYVTDVLVIKHAPAFGYIFFYITLSISLLVAASFLKQENQQKLLTRSLISLLILSMTSIILPIHSWINYAIYQIIFAFFLAIFLVPSLSIIFLMFKNNKLIFHGTMWFSTGYALGNLASDWLTEKYGFFTQSNCLPMLPLVFGSLGCLAVLLYTTNNLSWPTLPKQKFP